MSGIEIGRGGSGPRRRWGRLAAALLVVGSAGAVIGLRQPQPAAPAVTLEAAGGPAAHDARDPSGSHAGHGGHDMGAVDATGAAAEWTVREGKTYPAMDMAGTRPNYFTINGKSYPASESGPRGRGR
jgi:hypothetical protein